MFTSSSTLEMYKMLCFFNVSVLSQYFFKNSYPAKYLFVSLSPSLYALICCIPNIILVNAKMYSLSFAKN